MLVTARQVSLWHVGNVATCTCTYANVCAVHLSVCVCVCVCVMQLLYCNSIIVIIIV